MTEVKFISHKIAHYINSMDSGCMEYYFFDKFFDKTGKFDMISNCIGDSDTMHIVGKKTDKRKLY